jgi:hypothetical protein
VCVCGCLAKLLSWPSSCCFALGEPEASLLAFGAMLVKKQGPQTGHGGAYL